MCNISTLMYHVIHDDDLEIKLIVLCCIVFYALFDNRLTCVFSRIQKQVRYHEGKVFLGFKAHARLWKPGILNASDFNNERIYLRSPMCSCIAY